MQIIPYSSRELFCYQTQMWVKSFAIFQGILYFKYFSIYLQDRAYGGVD